jgi:hypothetical protein
MGRHLLSKQNKKQQIQNQPEMKISKHLYALAIAGACSASVYAQNTLTFDFLETSGNVQITVTGTVTPSLWSSLGNESPSDQFETQAGSTPVMFIYNYLPTPTTLNTRTFWRPAAGVTVSGPSSFGSGSYLSGNASASSSTSVGFFYNGSSSSYLFTPPSWTSPTQGSLANVITIPSATFSSLGFTAGSYSWSVAGSGVTDTVTFNIGSVTPVPEASGSVAGLGLAMAGLYQLRRRKAAVGKLSVES